MNARNYQVEVLLNNIVDKDVQLMLLPLNLMQSMMFASKYSIRYNFITPNRRIYNGISFCITALFIFLYIYCCVDMVLFKHIKDFNFVFYLKNIYDTIVYCFGFLLNYIINICQGKMSIMLVLTIQKVNRILNDEISMRKYTIENWISISSIFFTYILVCCYLRLYYGTLPIYTIINNFILICFDINVIYAIRIVKFLKIKTNMWRYILLNQHNADVPCDVLFDAYVHILDAYRIFKNTFQQMIIFHTVDSFLHALVFCQIIIEFGKMSVANEYTNSLAVTTIPIFLWLLKNLLLQVALCVECEKFYIAVDGAQDACLRLSSDCSDEEKRLCRNVQRSHRASFSKMSVYGIITVDAALSLKITGLITSYTIVLLQFAFLSS